MLPPEIRSRNDNRSNFFPGFWHQIGVNEKHISNWCHHCHTVHRAQIYTSICMHKWSLVLDHKYMQTDWERTKQTLARSHAHTQVQWTLNGRKRGFSTEFSARRNRFVNLEAVSCSRFLATFVMLISTSCWRVLKDINWFGASGVLPRREKMMYKMRAIQWQMECYEKFKNKKYNEIYGSLRCWRHRHRHRLLFRSLLKQWGKYYESKLCCAYPKIISPACIHWTFTNKLN